MNSAARPPARTFVSKFPAPILRTCCCWMISSVLPIPVPRSPTIDGDARRRRLTALVNAAALARTDPALYVIEDAHWIDDVSESMLADFLSVITQTPSTVLITYRPSTAAR